MLYNPRHMLTLAERADLERAFDGPIPSSAIEDKIAQRPVRTPEWLRQQIEQHQQLVRWHNMESIRSRTAGDTWMANWHNTQAITKLAIVDALQIELGT